MADNTTPNRAANKEKTEGDRSKPDQHYDKSGDQGGGITNRPLDDEMANQEAVPDRGHKKDEQP